MTIQELRFLTDENIDVEVVKFLRVKGFDVFDIKEQQLFRLSDKDILSLALEEQRVIISQDSDFGTLIFREGFAFWGIVYLRPGHESPEVHIQTMEAILDTPLDFQIPFIIVAENTGETVRIRLRNMS